MLPLFSSTLPLLTQLLPHLSCGLPHLSCGLPVAPPTPRTMSCLLRPSPWPRLALTAPSTRHHQLCKEHLLLPTKWPRVRLALGVRMAEMAMIQSRGALPEAEGEGDADALQQGGPWREANRWARVEAALNWAVSAS